MGFRNKDGDYLGAQSNYEYRGKKSLKRGKISKVSTLFWIILFMAFIMLASLFLFYVAFFENIPNTDKNSYLLSAVFLIVLAFYVIYRFRKYQKEEKDYEKELEKLENKKD